MTTDERPIWFIRVSPQDSSEIVSMITRVDGKECLYDKGVFTKERILALNSNSCGYWTWVTNPELTNIYWGLIQGNYYPLERRPVSQGELVAIRLAAKLYTAKGEIWIMTMNKEADERENRPPPLFSLDRRKRNQDNSLI